MQKKNRDTKVKRATQSSDRFPESAISLIDLWELFRSFVFTRENMYNKA